MNKITLLKKAGLIKHSDIARNVLNIIIVLTVLIFGPTWAGITLLAVLIVSETSMMSSRIMDRRIRLIEMDNLTLRMDILQLKKALMVKTDRRPSVVSMSMN